jgi:hypothetical protein
METSSGQNILQTYNFKKRRSPLLITFTAVGKFYMSAWELDDCTDMGIKDGDILRLEIHCPSLNCYMLALHLFKQAMDSVSVA